MLEKSHLKIVLILTLVIIFIIAWLFLTIRSIYFQKRINSYVISKDMSEDISILGKLENIYLKIRKKLFCVLKNKLKRKNGQTKEEFDECVVFICSKILTSILTLFIYFIITFITFIKPSILVCILVLILGYLVPTIKRKIETTLYQRRIEKDLLKAVSLINNSLQTGKSIIQAIKTVAKELEGPIAMEFQKIEKDLEKGLSLATAFTRFEKRISLEEIDYITVSLLMLNQTGGNIVSVFQSLEDRFYIRKKLDSELKATIASSKLVFQILIMLPVFIYLLIGFWNPTYFTIFFQSTLGGLLLSIIVFIYFIYIIVIRNIMKIDKY